MSGAGGAWIRRWREFAARLGGPSGVLGVLLCAALPVVPFGLLLASVLGRYWAPLASPGGAVGSVLVLWVLVLAWVFAGTPP
jgi:hypothetical protein